MFDPKEYLNSLTTLLKEYFRNRLRYIGLQGSYLREEATEESDIDIMVVIDGFSPADMALYRVVIKSLESPEKSCGFICGTEELRHWNPLEICHLLHTTKDYWGTLKDLVPEYTNRDVLSFVKMSLSNLYHEIGHRRIHASMEQNIAALPAAYKSVFFHSAKPALSAHPSVHPNKNCPAFCADRQRPACAGNGHAPWQRRSF